MSLVLWFLMKVLLIRIIWQENRVYSFFCKKILGKTVMNQILCGRAVLQNKYFLECIHIHAIYFLPEEMFLTIVKQHLKRLRNMLSMYIQCKLQWIYGSSSPMGNSKIPLSLSTKNRKHFSGNSRSFFYTQTAPSFST